MQNLVPFWVIVTLLLLPLCLYVFVVCVFSTWSYRCHKMDISVLVSSKTYKITTTLINEISNEMFSKTD